MRTRRSQRSATALVDLGFRRHAKSLLGELGSLGRGASVGGDDRGLVEGQRNLGVWSVAGQREVARPDDRVGDEICNTSVNALAVVAEVVVERRGQQRMREADRSVVSLDDVCRKRRVEGAFRDACLFEQHFRRCSDRRCKTERIACRRWRPVKRTRTSPRASEVAAVRADRHRRRARRRSQGRRTGSTRLFVIG